MKKSTLKKSNQIYADKAMNDLPSTLFVTDGNGNILISNEFTALTLGMSLEELLKFNVKDLVKAGFYKQSITMEAIECKHSVSRNVNTVRGFNIQSTATPILDKAGEVELVVTTSTKYKEKQQFNGIEQKDIPQLSHIFQETINLREDMGIVAESLAMKQIIKVCDQIAFYDSKVLILGESGTGKEVIANYIHRKSDRSFGPFVTVNCAAIPPSLFEYELFGYEKGAFAGADSQKKGLLESANDGFLFLDEIAEIPLDLQAKLLRVIETNEVRRVGSIDSLPINCRIITATNRDLWKMVKKKMFREDLYYRINVIPIHIPPLRNRKSDLVGLISHFIAEFNQKYRKNYVLCADEYQKILWQDWPGNARELRNYLERLVLTEPVNVNQHIDEPVTDWFSIDHFIKNNMKHISKLKDFTSIVEGRYIKTVLDACNGNGTEAAKKLGVDRSVIYRKLKKMEEVL